MVFILASSIFRTCEWAKISMILYLTYCGTNHCQSTYLQKSQHIMPFGIWMLSGQKRLGNSKARTDGDKNAKFL